MHIDLHHLDVQEERHVALRLVLGEHRDDVHRERWNYRDSIKSSARIFDGTFHHVLFVFAEKVLLPKLLRQPGELFFVTGKSLIFLAYTTAIGARHFYMDSRRAIGPLKKTASTVLSMLCHAIEVKMEPNHAQGIKKLMLLADSCAGRNKNRFVLMYIYWRAIVGLNDLVQLSFLAAGQTKNFVAGAFRHVKGRLKTNDTRTPHNMMNIMANRSDSNVCVPSAGIICLLWKECMEKTGKMPSNFAITNYRTFRFD